MKIRIAILFLSLVFCLSLCFMSNLFVANVTERVLSQAKSIEKLLSSGGYETAVNAADELNEYIRSKERILESLVPHEDLHDLSVQVEDVVLSIHIQDLDDCKKALALIRENAEHLKKHEAFSFGNIF